MASAAHTHDSIEPTRTAITPVEPTRIAITPRSAWAVDDVAQDLFVETRFVVEDVATRGDGSPLFPKVRTLIDLEALEALGREMLISFDEVLESEGPAVTGPAQDGSGPGAAGGSAVAVATNDYSSGVAW